MDHGEPGESQWRAHQVRQRCGRQADRSALRLRQPAEPRAGGVPQRPALQYAAGLRGSAGPLGHQREGRLSGEPLCEHRREQVHPDGLAYGQRSGHLPRQEDPADAERGHPLGRPGPAQRRAPPAAGHPGTEHVEHALPQEELFGQRAGPERSGLRHQGGRPYRA